ncbi:Uncharacterised protein [Acetobacterium wieringae]|jgi:hypothetical protein|uniref:hypothetical protein n=1 Tax=Acetobacterium wieringae TaxID=52694 RepID=UPI001DE5714A|nr:hypothetical protein [Acetobacterium wieringae]VUZ24344.1 Uncharacterised protein [Acetobacterium wieringae]VUZ27858.1 Uncharacterised protein [Acetobacterium wieringae]
MTEEAFALLLADVKNELDITWQDPETDKKITGIIKRGMAYIDNVAGATMDYTIEADARGLLFDYCRYVRAGALSEFMENYLPELLSLQQAEEVKAYVASKEAADI